MRIHRVRINPSNLSVLVRRIFTNFVVEKGVKNFYSKKGCTFYSNKGHTFYSNKGHTFYSNKGHTFYSNEGHTFYSNGVLTHNINQSKQTKHD